MPICSRSRLSVQLALIILSIQILVITILPITSQINLADDQLSWAGSIYSADLLKKLDPRLFNATYISWLASIANLSASEMLSLGYIVKFKPQNLGECYRELEYVLPPLSLKIFHIFRETRLLALKMDRIANSSEVLKAALKLAGIDCVEKIWVDNPRKIAIFDVNPLMGIIEARENNRVNGSGIRIAILDTGINTRNPDLLGSVIYWRDFINGRTEPYDDNGHGTMISGIIASRGLTKIGNGNRIWHSVNHDRSDEFNYAGPANLTYAVNVTQFRGLRLNISYIHAYWIERSGDYGAVMVRFDTVSSWVTLATYRGTMLITTPASHVVEIPANATVMYVSFIYSTDITSQLGGWWVDDIKIQDLFDTAKIILYDDVEGPPPRELISSYLWVRAPSRVEGIAPGSQLMAAKVCTSEGLCPDVAIMLGIEWAVLGSDGVPGTGDEAHIISLSFTAPAISYDPIMEMVDWAYSNGVTVVVSAGNSGPGYETLGSPGAARGAISVGASTKVNTIASFSSWGPSPVDYSLKPELVAYGVYIITTLASDQNPPLAIASGTSLSAPIVSGLAALLKQAHPYWGPEEIRSSLISTASTHLTPSRISNYTMNPFIEGAGIPNISRALTTRFLPVPAIVSFNITDGLNIVTLRPKNFSSYIMLTSYGEAQSVSVSSVSLYKVDGFNASTWVVSPKPSSIYRTNTTMSIEVSVPLKAEPGYYWGRILLVVDGQEYQVIFGFKIAEDIRIRGYVIDITTRSPVPNTLVRVTSPDLSRVFSEAYSDPLGLYEVRAPRMTPIRILANSSRHYSYISPSITVGSDARYDIYLTPRYGYERTNVLLVVDRGYGFFPFTQYHPDPSIFLNMSTSTGAMIRLWDNSIQGLAADAIFSGDFDSVLWLSGGVFTPIMDPLDLSALVRFSQIDGKTIVLEGGDIGWWHRDDEIMRKVAHAIFDRDMNPGNYSIAVDSRHKVFHGLEGLVNIYTGVGAPTIAWPDSVVPFGGSVSIARWSNPDLKDSIIIYENVSGARTLYITFPLNDISDPKYRNAIIRNIISWILTPGRVSAFVGGSLDLERIIQRTEDPYNLSTQTATLLVVTLATTLAILMGICRNILIARSRYRS